ncbi:hypothetical protein CRYUN_Cryun30bG0062800 [Craigia yunnanensis]
MNKLNQEISDSAAHKGASKSSELEYMVFENDGNSLQFKSVRNGKYLSAKSGGGTIAADQTIVSNDQFVGLEKAGKGTDVVAVSRTPVRIPVGWWIASDPMPPPPFDGGSLHALDNTFLWAQYAKSPSLYAVELINEPLSPGATLVSVIKYYKASYAAFHRHSSTAFVVKSNRLGPMEPRELFPMASCLRSVIDILYYNHFQDMFKQHDFPTEH